MIDGTIANHLEILRIAFGRCVGIGRVKGIEHADAFNRLLLDALDLVGRLDTGGFEYGWNDVNDVVELSANSADILDVAGPRNRHALPGTAEVRRHLLGPFKGRIECPRPRHCHMRIGLVGAPVVVMQ